MNRLLNNLAQAFNRTPDKEEKSETQEHLEKGPEGRNPIDLLHQERAGDDCTGHRT